LGKGIEYIKLVTFENFEKNFLNEIVHEVEQTFQHQVNIIEGRIDMGEFYDPTRRQYNGNEILKFVELNYADSSFKTLGLLRVDMFIPILTFIFGQAFLNGYTGIASLYRLKNEYYGMPPQEKLLRERFIKEVIHELGHTFGLKHCYIPTCVMRSSTYVEDIDQKSHQLCQQCKAGLK